MMLGLLIFIFRFEPYLFHFLGIFVVFPMFEFHWKCKIRWQDLIRLIIEQCKSMKIALELR